MGEFAKCVDGPLKGEERKIEEKAAFQTFIFGAGIDGKKHIYEVAEGRWGKELRFHHTEKSDDESEW